MIRSIFLLSSCAFFTPAGLPAGSVSAANAFVTSKLAANTTGQAVTGLAAGTTYYFRVRAVNGAGSSAYSSTASAATLAAATPPPGGTSSGGSSGMGGGGGAPSLWFPGLLVAMWLIRRLRLP